jgi:uncharacterized membrane protein
MSLFKPKTSPHYFLSKDEREAISEAIRLAETGTSGEIRVHVERHCKGKEPLERAAELFEKLGMTQTERRNGVLIYIALADHLFAIYGDQGIDAEFGQANWNEIRNGMQDHFRSGEFCAGIREAIEKVGVCLHTCFPSVENDTNELSNEPSIDLD